MTKKYILPLLLLFLAGFISSCDADIDEFSPDPGEADFSTFVSLGNSLTAGFMDGELYREGQHNSLGGIMAGQFMHAGLENFNQPLMRDDLGFGGRLMLAEVEGQLLPVPMPGSPDPGNYENIFHTDGPFHNLGVPGARVQHLLFEGYAALNPYYERFAADIQTSSVLTDALALNPSFFSLWIGSNDILTYAMSGGEGDNILPPEDFSAAYQLLVQQLTQNDALGVTANIPGITQIPYFTTVPYNALLLADPDLVNLLNAAYAEAPHISFEVGPNPLVVADPDHPAGIRQLEADELVLLPALDGILNEGWGSEVPIGSEYYLNTTQIEHIDAHIAAYNDIISATANEANLAMADVNQLLLEAEPGIYFDAIAFNTEFVSGGVFSLDGIHLSARGYAIVANAFIEAINNQYEANIPKVAIGNYPGIQFP